MITLGDLAKETLDKDKADGKEIEYDFARPQAWNDKMLREMRADPRFYVWAYDEGSKYSGRPINLAEEWVKRYGEQFKQMKYLLDNIAITSMDPDKYKLFEMYLDSAREFVGCMK